MRNKEALIIVDLQNDFCPGGALPVPDGDKVIEPLNKFIKFTRNKGWRIAASRDWHPEKTSHFEKWPVHCVQDTNGAAFNPNLDLDKVKIFSKGMGDDEDAYSAFDAKCKIQRHFTHFEELTLEDFLKEKSIKTVYIGGLATDYCVKATALDAIKRGFKAYLLTDAVAAVNLEPYDGSEAIEEMVNAGVALTNTRWVIEDLDGRWM